MGFERIGILGAGAWGSALANAIARAGRDVLLAARDGAAAAALARTRQSPRLPDVPFEPGVRIAAAVAALGEREVVLLAVPAQRLREAVTSLAPHLAALDTPLVICAKGIERDSRKFMSDVVADCARAARPAVLSGPSFASDVARGLPTAVTLAAHDAALAADLAQALGSATFRPYHSSDLRGVEIGGAAKNVLAIGAGIVAGRGLGASAQAALVTRGFAELFRFGRACGARAETLTGLSGLGDLVLTCSSAQSRNFAYGFALGRGERGAGTLAEGTFTATALAAMARTHAVEMPIVDAVAAILEGRLDIDAAIERLLTRPFRAEG